MTSIRGKWAGKAPRLRFGGLPVDGLVFASAAASSPATFSATDCSRASLACCTVSGARFSGRAAQLLRPAAEAMALQAGKLKLQPLDLSQRRAQDRLQRGGILGQVCGGFEHDSRLNPRCKSGLMNLA